MDPEAGRTWRPLDPGQYMWSGVRLESPEKLHGAFKALLCRCCRSRRRETQGVFGLVYIVLAGSKPRYREYK